MTLVSSFGKTFQTYAQKVAVEFNGSKVTFDEVNKESNRVANALKSLSVGKGDRVAFFLCNSLELIYFFVGILKNGSIAVPMNTYFKESEAKYMLNDSGAKVVLTDKARLPILKKILPELKDLRHIIVRDSNDELTYNEFIKNAPRSMVLIIRYDGLHICDGTMAGSGIQINCENRRFRGVAEY